MEPGNRTVWWENYAPSPPRAGIHALRVADASRSALADAHRGRRGVSAGPLTPSALGRLDVTHRVALETLRLYPIAPAITRTVTNAFDFGGYTIPAGERVIVATTVPHHLPECYPEPARFDIDRYLPARREHRRPGVFAPFGVGAHVCFGAGFAEVSVAATMATIVREVDLVLDPPGYRLRIEPVPTPHPDARFRFRVAARRPSSPSPVD